MKARSFNELKKETVKFVEDMLSPGTLVVVGIDNKNPYIFDTINIGPDGCDIVGDSWSLKSNEPCFIVSSIVDIRSIYVYIICRDRIGWLPTWHEDGIITPVSTADVS